VNNLLNKLKQGISNKFSFIPQKTSSTNDYKPNVDSINTQLEGQEVMQGSFNPEYQLKKDDQMIKDNYFDKKNVIEEENPDEYNASPIVIEEADDKENGFNQE